MITIKFNCDSCETKGKITIEEQDDTLNEADIAYCPICAHDITDNDDEEIKDEEQDE